MRELIVRWLALDGRYSRRLPPVYRNDSPEAKAASVAIINGLYQKMAADISSAILEPSVRSEAQLPGLHQ